MKHFVHLVVCCIYFFKFEVVEILSLSNDGIFEISLKARKMVIIGTVQKAFSQLGSIFRVLELTRFDLYYTYDLI